MTNNTAAVGWYPDMILLQYTSTVISVPVILLQRVFITRYRYINILFFFFLPGHHVGFSAQTGNR